MKVVITGGGTGGHIYPAVAIIEELKKRDENIEILYIGSKNSMESELIPSLNIDYKSIEVMGLPRKINLKLFKSVFVLLKGLSQAKKILKEFKPDVVIGTGGFVTGPVLFFDRKYCNSPFSSEGRKHIHWSKSKYYSGVRHRLRQ